MRQRVSETGGLDKDRKKRLCRRDEKGRCGRVENKREKHWIV